MSADEELEILLSEADIERRVQELAEEISRDYRGKGELILVGILKGAFIFLADLSRRLTIPRSIEFMAVSSYEDGDEASSAVRLVLDLRKNIEGKHVLVVEDIVDTGRTLHFLQRLLATRRPASVRTCALTRKPDRVEVDATIDYLGFEIPDAWVVGMPGARFSVRELAHAGVKRISVGSALARVALGAFVRASREIRNAGSFAFAEDAMGFAELEAFFVGPDPD